MEEACGRGGEGIRAMEHEAQESTDSAPLQLKGQKRMGPSGVYHIYSVLYCSILMCYTPLMEEKFSYKECIRTVHRSMKTALQISNFKHWGFFIKIKQEMQEDHMVGNPPPPLKAPTTTSVSDAGRCYLDLPHQLHNPSHLDEDLLLEGNWAVE